MPGEPFPFDELLPELQDYTRRLMPLDVRVRLSLCCTSEYKHRPPALPTGWIDAWLACKRDWAIAKPELFKLVMMLKELWPPLFHQRLNLYFSDGTYWPYTYGWTCTGFFSRIIIDHHPMVCVYFHADTMASLGIGNDGHLFHDDEVWTVPPDLIQQWHFALSFIQGRTSWKTPGESWRDED
jgi:hypothetical protein